ncbi:MAG: DUF177 domain-containing protein [Prevotellaceae bacterium]|jgi:uncharacterized metal-binding protein YceD (DUF177 family)|nr:DUF177 domain-containing protein [Prevotellaceae bacterium]
MGKFDKYKIELRDMQETTADADFLLDNLFFAQIEGEEVQRGKVHVKLRVKKAIHACELNFQIEGVVQVPCDRCLDYMDVPVATNEKILVKLGKTYGEEGSLIVVPESDGYINVAWLLYEFVSLAIPMKHVHSPGKCNKSMTGKLKKHLRGGDDDESSEDMEDLDFDRSGDSMDEPVTDPRWDSLKDIYNNN